MTSPNKDRVPLLKLPGPLALSEFRVNRLLPDLQLVNSLVTGVEARYIHLVDLNNEPTEVEQFRLAALLAYGDNQAVPQRNSEAPDLVVLPRFGTISPWSSKATEITRNCGLTAVNRLERGVAYSIEASEILDEVALRELGAPLHDRMTESVVYDLDEADTLFDQGSPRPLQTVDIVDSGLAALDEANQHLGLALSDDEMAYLVANFSAMKRNPTDAELMMFAQANSEHCRHKIFNARWEIDGAEQDLSLFQMIRNTHTLNPGNVLSAYSDNAAVIGGAYGTRFLPSPENQVYERTAEDIHIQIKVETHNHPTAISPFPGAATGSGGEIRDEGATGNGSKPKVGLCGFSVSNLKLPEFAQPWETDHGKPDRIVSARDIMIEGPIGAAAFNNEFGRPNLTGYFRTFESPVKFGDLTEIRGYHKPIMVAGGLGNIRPMNIEKKPVPAGAIIVVIGGPAMLIGLGGGAASSMSSGSSAETLDFASVQRGNPEMQRRCQEVIDRCIALGDESPVLSMHDVGAGGLSNALPELVNDAGRGAEFDLRKIPNDEPGMSPMEIWSCEAQERYVLAVSAQQIKEFEAICQRERCIYAIVGQATAEQRLKVVDPLLHHDPVNMPLEVLLGNPPKMNRSVASRSFCEEAFDTTAIDIDEAAKRVLTLPSVASKNFLITIGDRSITGQVVRDQLVGPWQMPVADVAVTVSDYDGFHGEAMAIGERAPIALINPAASARMAIGEALTNISATNVMEIGNISLSANWMAAAGHPGEDAALFDAVKSVGMELAPALGIAIPVGKDSLSMKTVWEQDGQERAVTSPMSVVMTAFSYVGDVRKTATPQIRTDCGETELVLIDLGCALNRLGGSALAQVYGQVGNLCPDVDNTAVLAGFVAAMQDLHKNNLLLAYHDRSDGGLFTCLTEMGIAGNSGLTLELHSLPPDDLAVLFAEELGAVVQIRSGQYAEVFQILETHGLGDQTHIIGKPNQSQEIIFLRGDDLIYSAPVVDLKSTWWETSYQMQKLRDNPACADEELATIKNISDPGISPILTFDPDSSVLDSIAIAKTKPRVAILREQGVNGQIEMASAFTEAGFEAVDVHMSDIIENRVSLSQFKGLVACGGFSYGDVLGAGGAWSKSILFNERARTEFEQFFERQDVFGLGVCNGCQMLTQLKGMIPGATHWPAYQRNRSEQFEARVVTVEIYQSPSIFLTDMAGSRLPVAVAHAEGRAVFESEDAMTKANVVMGFVDNSGTMTERYPYNPNGSKFGVTGLTSDDGRFTIMMPHPERVYRTVCNSWTPPAWGERGPWLRMFDNARVSID